MKFSGKMWPKIILKVTQKQRLTISLEKSQGGDVKLSSQSFYGYAIMMSVSYYSLVLLRLVKAKKIKDCYQKIKKRIKNITNKIKNKIKSMEEIVT